MTPEQQQALAIAQAKRKRAEAEGQSQPPQIPEGMFLNPNTGGMTSRELLRNNVDTSQGMAAVGGAMQGMSLGAGDELAGGIGYLTGGADNANFQREKARATLEANADAYPKTDFGARMAGAIAPALAGYGAVSNATSLTGRILTGAGLGGAGGATQGFLEGEGGVGSRLGSAGTGALIGGAIGGAIPAAAHVGKSIYSAGKDAWRGSQIGNTLGKELGVSPQAGRVVSELVGGGDEATMRASMAKAGPNAMLADASPNTAGMLDMSMRNPAPGAQIARTRVDERAGGAYHGVIDALTGNKQGPRMPPLANQSAQSAAARPTIHPLYQEAYDTAIDYSAPSGRKIEELMGRIPGKQAAKAIESATDRMIYDGVPNAQIMAKIGADGKVTFQQMPNVMQLDYIKRAFDEVAEASKDSITGKMSPDGAFASKVARDLRESVKDAVPKYGEALAAASTDIRSRAAVRAGQDIFQPQRHVEDVLDAVKDATPAELRHMREGVLAQIDHVMGNVRAVGSDQNIDAREAQKLFSDLSSKNAQQKLQALFGDEADAVLTKLNEAGAALGLRANVAGNSATYGRGAAKEMLDNEIAPSAMGRLEVYGGPKEMAQRAIGTDPASVARLSRDVQGELADLLTRPGGQETLSAVVRALTANPVQQGVGDGVQGALTVGGFTALPDLNRRLQGQLGTLPAR